MLSETGGIPFVPHEKAEIGNDSDPLAVSRSDFFNQNGMSISRYMVMRHRLLILLPTPGMGRRREKETKARREGFRACWPEDRSARSPRGSAPDCPGRQENGGGGSIESGPM